MRDPVETLPESDILSRGPDAQLYLGQSAGGREIWLGREDMTRHALVVGATGSGKTEMLLGMCSGALAAGSGLLFVDGKGDISTLAKISALAARYGRGHDVQLLNLANAKRGEAGSTRMTSHTIDPLLGMDEDAVVQVMTSLLNRGRGEDSMWHNRAIAMMTCVLKALVWLRDSHGVYLSPSLIRDSMTLKGIVDLHDHKKYPDMPSRIWKGLDAYLVGIPGYTEGKREKQAQTTLDQHGYLEMQTTRVMSMLVDVYGHIFDTGTSQIDIKDVVLNRRILVVLLPSLEKSSSEIAMMGQLVVAMVKNMMSAAMASPVEGSWQRVVEDRPTNASFAFLTIMDEVSHYLTDGMGLMAGQARSLGFCLVFATQDVASMSQANHGETAAIMANTNTKIFMGLQNPDGHDINNYLPGNQRFDNVKHDMEGRLRARLARLHDLYRSGQQDNPARSQIMASIEQTHVEMEKLLEENPDWSLTRTIKALTPGNFVLVRRGQFLRGRALYVSPSLQHHDIRLNRSVTWAPLDQDYIEHERHAQNKGMGLASRLSMLTAALDARPDCIKSVLSHYQLKEFTDNTSALEMAFHTAGHTTLDEGDASKSRNMRHRLGA